MSTTAPDRASTTHVYDASPGSRSGACRRCGLDETAAIHGQPPRPAQAPWGLDLRVLHATTVTGAPAAAARCAGSRHESPFPRATATVVLVLEAGSGPAPRLIATTMLDLCATCFAALPRAAR